MPRRYPLLILVTLVVVLASAYYGYTAFKPSGLPFAVRLVDARTAVVGPIAGIPLPPGLQAGDRLDLRASPPSARAALLPDILVEAQLSAKQTYDYVVRKDSALVTVPATSVGLSPASGAHLLSWLIVFNLALYTIVGLLLLWRGRDRTSAHMTLWIMAVWAGNSLSTTAATGSGLLAIQLVTTVCSLLARIGFYLTIESMLGTVLTPGRRRLFRRVFVLVLLASAAQQLGGVLAFVATGWAEPLRPAYGLVFSASYLVPVVMLFMSYSTADAAQRLRLRWILWSSVIWVAGICLSNTPVPWLGPVATNVIYLFAYVTTLAGFLYAVLRHRVMDVSVALDRTLVYGGMTALVVGVLAALNSLLQHAALDTSASLLLQIIVPLALGIVLGQVRNYADRIVERVFFRRKYLAEKALRRFARHCGGYENTQELLTATAQIISQKLGSPGVTLYLRKDGQYVAAHREGEIAYPDSVKVDDAAFAAVRAGAKDIDLPEIHSALGNDGYVFAMGTQAMLVCANRPGEHYAADELKLLAYVARQVGAALHSINTREDRDFVRAVARGVLEPLAAREQALKLEADWTRT